MIETTQSAVPEKTFHVYLRDGRTFAVVASTFARRLNPDDHIKFITSNGADKDDVFLRAQETAAIAPESSTVVPPPLIALQNDVDSLKIQLFEMKNSLGDIVARAVAEAFSQRGL